MGNDAYGIRVFRANGDVAFDSGLRYMRVIDAFEYITRDAVTRTYAAGRTYEWIPSAVGMGIFRDNGTAALQIVGHLTNHPQSGIQMDTGNTNYTHPHLA